jgi:hypothetical protein
VPPAPADFRRLLTALVDHRVDFVVVGGVAAVVQGAPVATFDLDIVPSLTGDNIEALTAALDELGATFRGRPELKPDATHLATRGHKLLSTSAGPLDVLGAIGDDQGFEQLIAHVRTIEAWELKVRVLDLAEIIRIKEIVGHPKDQAVLPVLRRTLEERGRDD